MSESGEPTPSGHHQLRGGHGRMRRRLLIVFVVVFAAIIGLAALGSAVGAPTAHPLCRPYKPCAPPRAVRRLINQTVWRSRRYGFSLEYPGNLFQISQQDAGSVTLQAHLGSAGTGTILIQGSGLLPGGPAEAISRQVGQLTGVAQLGANTNPVDQLLGPSVGYQPGKGRVYTGYFSAPQGVGQRVAVASEAASDGSVTVSVIVGAAADEAGPSSPLYQLADQIINSVRWPSDRSDSANGSGAP